MAKLGGSDGGGNFTKKENFKITDGDNGPFRIFPSIGLNGKEPNGKWSVFHRVHFGYKNSEGKMRVFESPLKKNKEKMVTDPDAALERIEDLKARLEKAKSEKNEAMIKKLSPLISGQKPLYNLDSNHYMNVITEDGKIGILKLRHKGYLALKAEIDRLKKEGVQPLSQNDGRFFIINRTGTGLETTFNVRVKTAKTVVNGKTYNEEVVHVIDDAIINRLDSEAGDLENLFPKLTSDQVAEIVKESELMTGKSTAIDRIFAKDANATTTTTKSGTQQAAPAQETSEEDYQDEPEEETQGISTKAAAPAPTPGPAVEQSLSKPTAKLADPEPAKASTPVAEMSDEDFLKSLEA